MASKKSPNFTELEKTVLIELVDSRKGIIESKQNDGEMISKKNGKILEKNLILAMVYITEV
jgi:hypothetical protein